MGSNIKIGQTIRVSIRFIDFSPDLGTDTLLEPTSVQVSLYRYDTPTDAYVLVATNLGPVVRQSYGIYYYDWTTNADGLFKVLFSGTLLGATPSTITNARNFYVGTATPTVTLGATDPHFFLSALSPMYIDPDEIIGYFEEGNPVEIAEIIYRNSVILKGWFGDTFVFTPLMHDYMVATTLCELTKIHIFDGGMNGFSQVGAFQLGDLQVTDTTGSSSGNKMLNRGNVDNWCELAALLRQEMNDARGGMRTAVRGSRNDNLIPNRDLMRQELRGNNRFRQ